jgi:hypothetical protein
MGESLMASWLKHVYKCHVVQTNWKISPEWGDYISPNEIKSLFQSLKKSFKVDLNFEFASKKMKSTQLVQQGEVDCIGIRLKMDNYLIVDKIYAVDVAFHENGLNYGTIDETCSRICKKYIRTALTIYQYLGTKEGEIIFATPKVLKSHIEKLKQVAVDVQTKFKELGFEYEFRLFCNEDFISNIFKPVEEASIGVADISELFIRSIKLVKLMDKGINKSERIKEVSINKENIESELSIATQMPIGVTIQKAFQNLSKEDRITEQEIKNLCDQKYSKDTLGLNFPALIKETDDESCGFINNYRRYYAQHIRFFHNNYLLCNHWIEANRGLFERWLSNINKA